MAPKISDVDKNFQTASLGGGLRFFDPWSSPAKIYGLTENRYARLPAHLQPLFTEEMAFLSTNTSGGRIRFVTDSARLGVRMQVTDAQGFSHMPLSGYSGLDFFAGEGAQMRYLGTRQPAVGENVLETELPLSGQKEQITVYLPLYNGIESLHFGITESAALLAPGAYTHELPIVFYGSSITQGGCATRPANSYPAMVARRLDSDFYNLGFSGNAKGEAWMADYISTLSMRCFVYDYDYNAPDPAHLRKTHLPFLKTILQKQPQVPVIILSCPNPDFSGPDFERREIILQTYQWAVSQGHRAYFVDGGLLLGTDGRDCCTVDGVHPNDLGFYRMAQAVYAPLSHILCTGNL